MILGIGQAVDMFCHSGLTSEQLSSSLGKLP